MVTGAYVCSEGSSEREMVVKFGVSVFKQDDWKEKWSKCDHRSTAMGRLAKCPRFCSVNRNITRPEMESVIRAMIRQNQNPNDGNGSKWCVRGQRLDRKSVDADEDSSRLIKEFMKEEEN